ncbi:4-(cytidine 5'-diphospho)-2-C-methyl-D-erythritol kinase [Thermosulfuriphilus sp.]
MAKRIQRILAPAKINLFLQVLGRRPDGYHDIYTLFQKVTLFDELLLELVSGSDIKLVIEGGEAPQDEGNLALQAARLLLDRLGWRIGLRLTLKKNIPMAAGLGGGSSDAASVLMGLNELLGCPLGLDELADLARALGADVPFFVYPYSTALGEGIGDRLSPWPTYRAVFVLFTPPVQVSTGLVYKKMRLTSRKEPFIYDAGQPPWQRGLINDLEEVTFGLYPGLREIKAAFIAFGARASLMSGSGPTIFAVFEEAEAARRAGECLLKDFDGQLHIVEPYLGSSVRGVDTYVHQPS